jgi:hypothetical protein
MKTLRYSSLFFLEKQEITDLFFLPVREAAAAAVPLLVASVRAAAGAASYEVRHWLRLRVSFARLPGWCWGEAPAVAVVVAAARRGWHDDWSASRAAVAVRRCKAAPEKDGLVPS